jgi:integral membrane protein
VANSMDIRTTAGRFRLVALLEAVSWIGLLAGMFFKYVGTSRTEIGVKIFGPVHGGVFMAFLLAALLAGIAFKWGIGTWLLALLGSIVPLGSVIFLIWADKTARLGSPADAVIDSADGGPGAGRRGVPAQPVPDAT